MTLKMTCRSKLSTSIHVKHGGGYVASLAVFDGTFMSEYIEEVFGTIREAEEWLSEQKEKRNNCG